MALAALLFATALPAGAPTPSSPPARDPVRIESGPLRLALDARLWARGRPPCGGRGKLLGPYRPSEYLTVAGKDVTDYARVSDEERSIEDALGSGRRLTIVG